MKKYLLAAAVMLSAAPGMAAQEVWTCTWSDQRTRDNKVSSGLYKISLGESAATVQRVGKDFDGSTIDDVEQWTIASNSEPVTIIYKVSDQLFVASWTIILDKRKGRYLYSFLYPDTGSATSWGGDCYK